MTLEEAKDFLTHYICCCPYGTSPADCGDDKCVFGMAIRILCDNARPTGEWISVSERLPEEEGHCIVSTDYGDVTMDSFVDGIFVLNLGSVTAWQPLPEKYKEEDNEG